jgi:hypothetical protein
MDEVRAEEKVEVESDFLASRWLWRGVWLFIAGLMLLLFAYEFLWMD